MLLDDGHQQTQRLETNDEWQWHWHSRVKATVLSMATHPQHQQYQQHCHEILSPWVDQTVACWVHEPRGKCQTANCCFRSPSHHLLQQQQHSLLRRDKWLIRMQPQKAERSQKSRYNQCSGVVVNFCLGELLHSLPLPSLEVGPL